MKLFIVRHEIVQQNESEKSDIFETKILDHIGF